MSRTPGMIVKKTILITALSYKLQFCSNFLFLLLLCNFLLQVVEDGYEFFAKRQLVTLFSAPNYCGEFDNAGGMMSVDETLMCSFQVIFQEHIHNQFWGGG